MPKNSAARPDVVDLDRRHHVERAEDREDDHDRPRRGAQAEPPVARATAITTTNTASDGAGSTNWMPSRTSPSATAAW